MANTGYEHAQWTAGTFDWNAVTMEAYNTRGTGKKRKPGGSTCQVPGCNVDLSDAKPYFKRHCICPTHMKAVQVLINGEKLRYCQQCGRFENVDQFIGGNRSCKMSLERRSAIAQASKQKVGRSLRSRDQQVGREQSTSDNMSTDKGDGSGDKGSPWGSPAEVVQTESGKRTALGDQSFPARDVDLAVDSSNPQGLRVGGRLSGPIAASMNPAVSSHPKDLPVLNLRPADTSSNNLTDHINGAIPTPKNVYHQTKGIQDATAALNISGSNGQATLKVQPPCSWPDVEMSDGAWGGGSADGGGDVTTIFGGGLDPGLRHPQTQLGLAVSPLSAMMSTGTSTKLHAGHCEKGSWGPAMGDQQMQATMMNPVAPVMAGTGMSVSGRLAFGDRPGAAISGNQTLTYPRSGRLLGAASMQPQLFSAAPSAVVAALGAANLSDIHDPGLEKQLQDIVNSARLEGQGWYSGTPSTALENSTIHGAPCGNSSGGAAHGGFGLLRGGASIFTGRGSVGQQVRQLFTISQAGASAGVDVGTGDTSHSQMSSSRGTATASFHDSAAASRGGRVQGSDISVLTGPWYQAGAVNAAPSLKNDLTRDGNVLTNSSLQTCMHYLQQQPVQQQQELHGLGYSGGGGGSGMGAMPHGYGAPGLGSASTGLGQGATRVLSYRSGEPDQLVRVALKLTNRAPDELEPSTVASLRKLLSVYDKLQSVQGYIRPGCTQIIIDAHRALAPGSGATGSGGGSSNEAASAAANDCSSPGIAGGMGIGSHPRCTLASDLLGGDYETSATSSFSGSWWCDESNNSVWAGHGDLPISLSGLSLDAGDVKDAETLLRNPTMLTALRDIAKCNDTALICQLDDVVISVSKDGAVGDTRKLTGLPTIIAASHAAFSIDNIKGAEVTVYGTNLDRVGLTFWARMHGVCFQLQYRVVRGGGVVLRLPVLNQLGLCQLEAWTPEGLAVGPAYPMLVLPSTRAVDELHSVASAMGPASLRRFIADFGFILSINTMLSQPLNGVVPARDGPMVNLVPELAIAAIVNTSSANEMAGSRDPHPFGETWGSTESTEAGTRAVGGITNNNNNSGVLQVAEDMKSIRAAEVAFMAAVASEAEAAAAAVMAGQMQQPPQSTPTSSRRRGAMSRGSSRNSSPTCSCAASGEGVLGNAADPTEAMTNADDEHVVELILNAGAVRSLLETSLALLRILVDRRMHHCTQVIVSRLCELAERFPDRVHSGLAPPLGPGPAFGLMHAAARVGDVGLLESLLALEGLLGEHCSVLAKGINGVTPLHLMVVLPQGPGLVRSLQRLYPELGQALLSCTADDGVAPIHLYQMLHLQGQPVGVDGGAAAVANVGECSLPLTPVGSAGGSLPSTGEAVSPPTDADQRMACSFPTGTAAVPVDMLLAAAAAAELGSESEAWLEQGEAAEEALAASGFHLRPAAGALGTRAFAVERMLRAGVAVASKGVEASSSAADDLLTLDGCSDTAATTRLGNVCTLGGLHDMDATACRAALSSAGMAMPPERAWSQPTSLQSLQQQPHPRRQGSQPSYSCAPTSVVEAMLGGAACVQDMDAVLGARAAGSTARARLLAVRDEAAATSMAKAQPGPGLKHLPSWSSFSQIHTELNDGTAGIPPSTEVRGTAGTKIGEACFTVPPMDHLKSIEGQSESWAVQAEMRAAEKMALTGMRCRPVQSMGPRRPPMTEEQRNTLLTALRTVTMANDDTACGGQESVASTSSFGASNSTCSSLRNTAAAIAAAVGVGEQWSQSLEPCWPATMPSELLQHHQQELHADQVMALGPPADEDEAVAKDLDDCDECFTDAPRATFPETFIARRPTLAPWPGSAAAVDAQQMPRSLMVNGESEGDAASKEGTPIRGEFAPAKVRMSALPCSHSSINTTTPSVFCSVWVIGPVLLALGACLIAAKRMRYGIDVEKQYTNLPDGFAHGSAVSLGSLFLTWCSFGLLLLLLLRLQGREGRTQTASACEQ